MTSQVRVQHGNSLLGFCGDDDKLYCLEGRFNDQTVWLTVYYRSGASGGSLSLLNVYRLRTSSTMFSTPSVDNSSHWVYVPCGKFGVRIFRYHADCLLQAREPLICVGDARSIAVNAPDTVFVSDFKTDSVCLVSVSTDTVIRRLERPAGVEGHPFPISLLGQTVLVCYDECLVTYHSDSPTPGHKQVLQVQPVGIAADTLSSSFICVDILGSMYVYVSDDKNCLWHLIRKAEPQPNEFEKYSVYDRLYTTISCAVVQSQLLLGKMNGDIIVLPYR